MKSPPSPAVYHSTQSARRRTHPQPQGHGQGGQIQGQILAQEGSYFARGSTSAARQQLPMFAASYDSVAMKEQQLENSAEREFFNLGGDLNFGMAFITVAFNNPAFSALILFSTLQRQLSTASSTWTTPRAPPAWARRYN